MAASTALSLLCTIEIILLFVLPLDVSMTFILAFSAYFLAIDVLAANKTFDSFVKYRIISRKIRQFTKKQMETQESMGY